MFAEYSLHKTIEGSNESEKIMTVYGTGYYAESTAIGFYDNTLYFKGSPTSNGGYQMFRYRLCGKHYYNPTNEPAHTTGFMGNSPRITRGHEPC